MDTRSLDLAKLIAVVAEEVMAASRRPVARCACHAVADDCCPTRLRSVVDAGAARLGFHATPGASGDVAGLIDHTLLKADATRQEIEQLCKEAAEHGFATVCVNPAWVLTCASRLRGTTVGVCTVVGFPLGASVADVKHFETHRAIFDGAREVDMVKKDIEAVTGPCRAAGVLSKVIIEAAYLTDEEKISACSLAKAAGADFVKTSTGFGPSGATVADVALMRRIVGPDMGVKAAGGGVKIVSAGGSGASGTSGY